MGREEGRRGYESSAHLYDLFDDKPNLEFFLLSARGAGEALDVGAGTGRIAMHLARAGLRLTCIEPSPAMRREFERKLDREPELRDRVELIAGSADSFDLGREFPLAILSGCFDHFLDDEERLASLSNIARHLKAGGRLVFDAFPGFMKDRPLMPAGEVEIDDLVYTRQVGGRLLSDGTRDTELVFETFRGDVLVDRVVEHSRVGVTSREHIRDLLGRTGFRIVHEYGGYEFHPYESGDLLVVEAVRT